MSKSTADLGAELNGISDLQKYLHDNQEELLVPEPLSYLLQLAQKKDISKAQIIRDAQLERTFGYHLLDGSKTLTRNKALALVFAARLTTEEANTFLKYAQLPQLYPRNRRDNVILFCLQKQKSLQETNCTLDDFQLECIQ